MELDITKIDRQKAGINKWRNANGKGTLAHPPRFGKTYEAIVFAINPHLNNNSNNRVIVLVPSEITGKQWDDNLKSYADSLDRITVYTANYLASNPEAKLECSFLIVDELQKFLTDDRKAMLDGTRIKHHYRLGLTGTYPRGIEWIDTLYPIVDTITEEEAITNGWTSPFVEYNILLEFPVNDKARYEKFSKPITESLLLVHPLLSTLIREENKPIFENELKLLQACKAGFKTTTLSGAETYITYDRLCNTIAFMQGWSTSLDVSVPVNAELHALWSPMAIHERAKTFMDYIGRRNQLMIDNPIKLEMIGELIARNLVPTIIFNESTVFADSVADYINARFNGAYRAACYHSKLDSKVMIDPSTGEYFKFTTGDRKGLPKTLGKDKIKSIVIQAFKEGYYHCISTAHALDEGLDVSTIEQVITTGGTTNPMTYQQRTARGKTMDSYNPNKVTKIFNLVFDDFSNSEGELIKSRDKTKLVVRQKETGSTVKWIKTLDDIKFSDNE
jgi:superfamily II DNA or RNA helicase